MKKLLSKIWRLVVPETIVSRYFFNNYKLYFSLKNNAYYLFLKDFYCWELDYLPELDYLSKNKIVWDLGCNIGLFSIQAAYTSLHVFAADISNQAIELLEMNSRSCFAPNVISCNRAVTVDKIRYNPALNSYTENKLKINSTSIIESMTYLEAAKCIGIPSFIKMDIEGAEKEFLESREFYEWAQINKIRIAVELHDGNRVPELWLKDSLILDKNRAVLNYHL